jgi:hypothetical protein
MEGIKTTRTRARRLRSLAVLHEFVGGRLERQWLSRAYELVAPTVCVVAGRIRAADSLRPSEREEAMVEPIAKGA